MKKTNLTIRLKNALVALEWPVDLGCQKNDYINIYKQNLNILKEAKAKPPKKITIDMFIPVVPWQQIQALMMPELYRQFCKYMEGQTCIEGGVFIGDLDRFLRNLPIID